MDGRCSVGDGGGMRAVVVFESLWGNTGQVAREIAAGIGGESTDVVDAVSAPDAPDADIDLPVVGEPTHTRSPCQAGRHASRRSSKAQSSAALAAIVTATSGPATT